MHHPQLEGDSLGQANYNSIIIIVHGAAFAVAAIERGVGNSPGQGNNNVVAMAHCSLLL
jgi:hypothetical protein